MGYLGYPASAYLMKIGKLSFSEEYSKVLKNIYWKNLNQKYKNNFDKTKEYIDSFLVEKGMNLDKFEIFTKKVLSQIDTKQLNLLGEKQAPPKGY